MPRPTPLAIHQRVLALRQDGHKQADITDFLGISQSAVCKILKRNREEGHWRPRKSPGRPRLTTRRDDWQLLNQCRRNRKMPARRFRRLWRRHSWNQRFPPNCKSKIASAWLLSKTNDQVSTPNCSTQSCLTLLG